MTPQKTIILESTFFLFSIAITGLLIISHQTLLLELLASIQDQIQDITRVATHPATFQ